MNPCFWVVSFTYLFHLFTVQPFIYLCNHLFTVQPFIYCATILFTVQPFIYCATIYLSGYTYEHSTIHIIILNKLSLLTL